MAETKLMPSEHRTPMDAENTTDVQDTTSYTTTSTSKVYTGLDSYYTSGDRPETVKCTIDLMFQHDTSGWFQIFLNVDEVEQEGTFYTDTGTGSWQRVSRVYVFDVPPNTTVRLKLIAQVSAGTGNLHSNSSAYNPTFLYEPYPRQS